MKTTLLKTLTLLLTLGIAFGFASRVLADGHPGDGGGGGDHPSFGFMLQPTADAPAGAGGWVSIRNHDGAPTLHVVTRGLAPGVYTVNVTATSDGSVVALGTFGVATPPPPPPPPFDHNGGDDGEEHPHTEANLPFPAGYNLADIASAQVADANGVTLLSGDNSPGHPGDGPDHNHQHFALDPTADAPAGAKGHAKIEVEDDDDLVANSASLKIEVEGLLAGAYTVNVTSLADGSVTVLGTFDVAAPAFGDGGDGENETHASLPFPDGFDVMDVASVQVADANGVVLLAGDASVRGGEVEGSEDLHQKVELVPTADAPVGSGGRAAIIAANEEGVTTATLRVKTHGLDVGTDTVSVTSLADGSVTVLGTFDVVSHDDGEEDHCEFGEAGLPFPAGFNPLDVATVQIADANGVVLLTGDFSNVTGSTNTHYVAKVRVTPGAAAPHAKGLALASAKVRNHVLKQHFTLKAKGAPAGATLTLRINGSAVGSVTSTATGRVLVQSLPDGVKAHKIRSVSLENADGVRVLSAHF